VLTNWSWSAGPILASPVSTWKPALSAGIEFASMSIQQLADLQDASRVAMQTQKKQIKELHNGHNLW
jgi:hypothetical protein